MRKKAIEHIIKHLSATRDTNRKYKLKFNMDTFCSTKMGGFTAQTNAFSHKCGTSACIAGWANILLTKDGRPRTDNGVKKAIQEEEERVYYFSEDEVDVAREKLGLDYDTARSLFYPTTDLRSWDTITPREAIKVLKHLLKTGEVDWSIIEQE